MTDEKGDSGDSQRPRSALFDPLLSAKVFGEIQAEGLRAAGALVERLVHPVDGPLAQHAPSTEADTEEHAKPAAAAAVLPWFELWGDLVERTSDTLQRLRSSGEDAGIHVDLDSTIPIPPLVIAVHPGAEGAGDMWLHNGTPSDHGALVPHCGDLAMADGRTLECDVAIEPPSIDTLHARSSRGFAISVSVAPSANPGTYRGVVQVAGAAAVWMPIEVVVQGPAT